MAGEGGGGVLGLGRHYRFVLRIEASNLVDCSLFLLS